MLRRFGDFHFAEILPFVDQDEEAAINRHRASTAIIMCSLVVAKAKRAIRPPGFQTDNH